MSGTSVLLGGGYPWLTFDAAGVVGTPTVVANAHRGLSLPSLADGPLGLLSADGSLGRLVLPRGVAIDRDAVFVLAADGSKVYRYDPLHQRLDALAHIGLQGLHGTPDASVIVEPRRFARAVAIAVLHGVLYVADPEARRVQVFDTGTLALLCLHADIDIVDLAAGTQAVYLLDRHRGRVLAAMPGHDRLDVVVDVAAACGGEVDEAARARHLQRAEGWDRIAVDCAGRICVRHRIDGTAGLDVFDLAPCVPACGPVDYIVDAGAVRDRFEPPLVTMDAAGDLALPDRLRDPGGLRRRLPDNLPRWEVGDLLYVADPDRRELRVHQPDGRVRYRFGPLDADGMPCAADADDAWSPIEVVAVEGMALVLDERHQVVWRHRGDDASVQFAFAAGVGQAWHRMAIDARGCLLLWRGGEDDVDRLTPQGRSLGRVALAAVRARFDRERSTRQPARDRQDVLLSRSGVRPGTARMSPTWPPARFERDGEWTSAWFDSENYDCAWHLVEIAFARLPPGSVVVVGTRTRNTDKTDAPVGDWIDAPPFVAEPQPDPLAPAARAADLLVQSAEGRHLQLRIRLAGSGTDTPVIDHLRLRYPRESLLDYLPALYASPPEQRSFLDRYLSIMQTTWSGIESDVATFERYVDPASVPDDAMDWLAGWLDLPLEGGWTPEQNRRLLMAMPAARTKWGTVDGLRDWVRLYLANIAAVDDGMLRTLGVPAIVENFMERRRLQLGMSGATLGAAEALWSPSVERRFQLDVFDRLGEVELVSTGDPAVDVFNHDAHSFRVHVPAALIRKPEDEALLRRAIDQHKPAHTTYELVLVEPRLRVGVQSTIDLDTVIGGPQPGRLACAADAQAPTLAPHGLLGHDTLLQSNTTHRASGPLA